MVGAAKEETKVRIQEGKPEKAHTTHNLSFILFVRKSSPASIMSHLAFRLSLIVVNRYTRHSMYRRPCFGIKRHRPEPGTLRRPESSSLNPRLQPIQGWPQRARIEGTDSNLGYALLHAGRSAVPFCGPLSVNWMKNLICSTRT